MSKKPKHYFILYTVMGIITFPIFFIILLFITGLFSDGMPQFDFYTLTVYAFYSAIASLLEFGLGYMLFLHGRRNVL